MSYKKTVPLYGQTAGRKNVQPADKAKGEWHGFDTLLPGVKPDEPPWCTYVGKYLELKSNID